MRAGLPALAAALDGWGSARVLCLTGPSRRHLDAVRQALGQRPVEVFDGARVHVPAETVTAASATVDAFAPDVLVAIGGGAPTGLGKLLRLQHALRFVVVPTTFSGSEMTGIWGRTQAGRKTTGRDPRVRPDLVVHDPLMVADMPLRLAVASAGNALAHPLSALSTGALDADQVALALDAAARIWSPLGQLAGQPDSADARFLLLRGAALAGRVIDTSPLGLHHRLAHLLGAHFGLEHSAVHSVLLPHTLGLLRSDPEMWTRLCADLGNDAPGPALHAILGGVGCATSLAELGVDASALESCAKGLRGLGPQAWSVACAAASALPPT